MQTYLVGERDALRHLGLFKTAGLPNGASLRNGASKVLGAVSRFTGGAAQKLNNPAPPVPPKPPSALGKAITAGREYGYPLLNTVGGYFSNENQDTPTSERLRDAFVGGAANLGVSKMPKFGKLPLMREAGLAAGMIARPMLRESRKEDFRARGVNASGE